MLARMETTKVARARQEAGGKVSSWGAVCPETTQPGAFCPFFSRSNPSRAGVCSANFLAAG
jgi:hypothetical protein